MPAVSIFNGVDEIIDDALGLGPKESLTNKKTCRRLCDSPPKSFSPKIVPLLYEQVLGNWRGGNPSRKPSRENWRHEPQTKIGPNNTRQETVLEKAIAVLAERGDLPDWCNQIPVASGLVDESSDKRAAVDLVHLDGDTAELIELKWVRKLKRPSDTPLSALFQVLRYGLALLLSRRNAKIFGYTGRPLIEADTLRLVVLAPAEYYEGYNLPGLAGIADIVNRGLQQLSSQDPNMSLCFMRFPMGFEIPFDSGRQVNAMRADPKAEAWSKLRDAVERRQPLDMT